MNPLRSGRTSERTERPVVCFSANDWDDIASSKWHIMRHLGRRRRVLYIETLGIRQPRASSHDLHRALEKLRLARRGVRQVGERIWTWSPLAIPWYGIPAFRWLNARFVAWRLGKVMKALRIEEPEIWSYLPHAVDVIERLPRSGLVYHCIDDYAEFTDAPRGAFEAAEGRLLQLADLTVVSARRLLELKRQQARRIEYIPHGVNLDELQAIAAKSVALPELDSVDRPIAGFVGRIADWIDIPLIARCAEAMPDWCFVLVGPSNLDLSAYEGIENLRVLGRKPYEQIPHYLRRFDVCLNPFRSSRLVESVNPLKLYEYLALGRPVVSTPMPEIEEFAEVVRVVAAEGFPEAIRQERESDSPAARQRRIEAVSGRSWSDIADRIESLLQETMVRGVR